MGKVLEKCNQEKVLLLEQKTTSRTVQSIDQKSIKKSKKVVILEVLKYKYF